MMSCRLALVNFAEFYTFIQMCIAMRFISTDKCWDDRSIRWKKTDYVSNTHTDGIRNNVM